VSTPDVGRRAERRLPRLRIGEEGDRHATWLELFFDLVFVVAIAALAGYLHDNLTPGGFLGFLLLFAPVGWVWMSFAYYADQFDTDDALFRIAMLAAMLGSAVLAVNVGGALGPDPAGFVLANVALRALLVGLYAWAWRGAPAARPISVRYATGFSVGSVLWLGSLLAPEPLRYALWALALALEMGMPVFSYSTFRSVPGHASHMPERFGLFTILVLGESVIILTSGVIDTSWQPGSVLAAVGGFVVAACLWWLYFDRIDEEAIGQSFTSGVAGVVRSHVWGYGHLLVWAGIAAASIGIEFAILEASEPALAAGPRAALCGGISLYLLAIGAVQRATPGSLANDVLAARLSVAAFAAFLMPLGAYLGPLALVCILAISLSGLTAFETRRPGRAASDAVAPATAPGPRPAEDRTARTSDG
jgi:low temperature requirement protein LtrA